ncbi:MAG: fibronectin type III domain-containing protein, partial [Prevotellaceae bacterium]|nr:fibronectin type III domain-containing protein [Prevotellaceae bacterium]
MTIIFTFNAFADFTVRWKVAEGSTVSDMYIYSWAADDVLPNGDWPGTQVTTDIDGWYSVTFTTAPDGFIFNSGDNSFQSPDITWVTENTCFEINSIYNIRPIDCETGEPLGEYSRLINNPIDEQGYYIVKWDCANNTWASSNNFEIDQAFTFAVDITGTPLETWLNDTPTFAGATRGIAVHKWTADGDFSGHASRLKRISGNIFAATISLSQIAEFATDNAETLDVSTIVAMIPFGFEYDSYDPGFIWWQSALSISYFKTLPYTGAKTSPTFNNNQFSGFWNTLYQIHGYAPTCATIIDFQLLSEQNITPTTADLRCYLNGVDVISRQLLCNSQTINITSTGNNISQTVTGLSPNTTYSYTFIATFANGEWRSVEGSFTTPCDTMLIPWLEDFENITTGVPLCWERRTGTAAISFPATIPAATTASYLSWRDTQNGTPGKHLGWNFYQTFYRWLTTPIIDLGSAANTYELTFDLGITAYSNNGLISTTYQPQADDKFYVMISTDGGTTWEQSNATLIDNTQMIAINALDSRRQEITIPLSSYTGNIKVAFYAESTASGEDFDIHIDNVRVGNPVTCFKPEALAVQNIAVNSAELNWTPSGEETEWAVQYKLTSASIWTNAPNATATQYTLSGLSENSQYDVRVKAVCSVSDESAWTSSITFTTPCGVTPAPWTEDFENITTGVPDCWTRVDGLVTFPMATPATANIQWMYTNDDTKGLTGKHIRMNNYGADKKAWAITPAIDLGVAANNYQLTFDLSLAAYNGTNQPTNGTGVDDKFYVMISTDGGNTWLESNTTKWDNAGSTNVYNNIPVAGKEIAIPLTSYTGVIKVAFYAESTVFNADDYISIDNVKIANIPTCLKPTNAAISNITNNSADIQWTASGGGESAWNIIVSDTLVTDFAAVTPVSVTSNSYSATDLNANTQYYIYVQADCGETDGVSEWSYFGHTRTLCAAEELDYSENFNNADNFNSCWTKSYNSYSGLTSYGFATQNVKINAYSTGTQSVLSPLINLGNGGNTSLKFKVAVTDYNSSSAPSSGDVADADDVFAVVVSTDGTLSLSNAVMTWDNSTTSNKIFNIPNTGEEFEIDLSSYSGKIQLAFVVVSTVSGGDYDIHFDDVDVHLLPLCPKPTNVAISNITNNSADIQWTSNTPQWNVVISDTLVTDFSSVTPVSVTNTYYSAEDLNANTPYYIYVQADCGEIDSVSQWTNVVTFKTLPVPQTPAELPYIQDFTENAENSSWTLLNGLQTNKWHINDVAKGNGDNTLHISNTDTTYNFELVTSYVYAYRTLNFTETGIYAVSFDWKNYGYYYNYNIVRAFLVPVSVQLTEGNAYGMTNNNNIVPNGWIAVSEPLYGQTAWQQFFTRIAVDNAGLYNLVFFWKNTTSYNYQPPAAIDNIQVELTNPLAGTYTIDNTLPTENRNFNTFKAAFDALNYHQTSDTVIFNITAGQVHNIAAIDDNTRLRLNGVGSTSKPIIFQKSGVGANPLLNVSGTNSTDYALLLDNVQYITFDGINIQNAGTSSSNYVEQGFYLNNTNHITVKNCNIRLRNTSSNYAVYVTNTNNDNLFQNNNITQAYYGYYFYNNTNGYDNHIESGKIDSVYCGIYTYYYGYSQHNLTINKVKIHANNSSAYGIYLCLGNNQRIFNNEIAGFNYGIYFDFHNSTDTSYVAHNTIYLPNNNGSYCLYKPTANHKLLLNNNIFVNKSTNTAARCIYGDLTNILPQSNNNLYYIGTSGYIHPSAKNINDYKALFTNGAESNSKFGNVSFVSETYPYDLHINTAVPTKAESGGIPLDWVVTDLDNVARNVSTPDIGAYEFDGIIDDTEITPLSGIYTIDIAQPTQDRNFNTFREAFNALHICGTSDTVIFNITAGQVHNIAAIDDNTRLRLNGVGSATKPIIFQKSGGGANPLLNVSGTSDYYNGNDYCVLLDNVQYITFDGIDIHNTGTSSSNYVERGFYLNNINHITVKNCNIRLRYDSYNYAFYIYNTNNDNLFQNNNITQASYGYYFYGTGNNNHIESGKIDSVSYGIYLGSTQNNLTIEKTKIYANNSFSYGIYLYYGNNQRIFNNEIVGFNYGIYFDSHNSTDTSYVAHNTILPNNSGSYCLYKYTANHKLLLNNNIFVNKSTNANACCIYGDLTNILPQSNNNLYYVNAGKVYRNSSTSAAALTDYQTLLGDSRERNSAQELPPFISTDYPYNLNLRTDTATAAESGGTFLDWVTTDIEGNPRQGTPEYTGNGMKPDMGAYEFEGKGKNFQAICSNNLTDLVDFENMFAAAAISWQIKQQPANITGFDNDGTGNLPAMQLFNLSEQQDTLIYSVFANTDFVADYNIVVYPQMQLGVISENIFPADNSVLQNTTVTFSWQPVTGAAYYDIYIWNATQQCPANPTRANLTAIQYAQSSNFAYGNHYKWKIVAKNLCGQVESDTFNFELRQLPDLHISYLSATAVNNATRQFTANYTVKNDGAGATLSQKWIDRIWLVPDISQNQGTSQSGAILLYNDSCLQTLGAGELYNNQRELTLPDRFYGNYWLIAAADMSNVSYINWTPAGGTPPEVYSPSLNGSPYPYLYTNGYYLNKTVIENGEDNYKSDNFYYTKIVVPQPPIETFIHTSKDTVNFGDRTLLLSDSTTVTVSVQDLAEQISFSITGDNEAFQVTPLANYTNTEGGNLKIKFTPTEIKNYQATLTLVSDTAVKNVILKGAGVMPTDFTVTAQTPNEIYASQDTIVITGNAVYNNGMTADSVRVEVCLEVMGYRRVKQAITDETGNYSVKFVLQFGECGHYNITAYRPAHVNYQVKDQFDIPGMKLANSGYITWEVEKDIERSGNLTIQNRSNIPLHNIQIETVQGLSNANVQFGTVSTLNGSANANLSYTVTGTALTATGNWEELKFQAASDEGIVYNFSVWFYCKAARGALETNPSAINTLMTKGQEKIVEFDLWNYGNGATGKINVSVPQTSWLTLASPDTISSLAPNDSAKITLRLYPDETVPLHVPFTGSIAVNCANGNNKTIPFNIQAVSDSTGTLVVDVVDEYYRNTDAKPHLANAHVKVTHPYSFALVAEGYTDANGIFRVETLPEGYYTLFVEADKHKSYRNNILVEAGETLSEQIFISFQAITYSWSVVPTEIEDHYEVELITRFETNVPKPVVTLNMPSKMPALSGDETYYFELNVTNHGLITAFDVEITFPEDEEYQFDYLLDKFDLAAQSTQTIPVIMRRKNSIGNNPAPALQTGRMTAAQNASSAGNNCVRVVHCGYHWICGPETNYNWVQVPYNYDGRSCGQNEITQQINEITQNPPPRKPCTDCGSSGSSGTGGGYTLPVITPTKLCECKDIINVDTTIIHRENNIQDIIIRKEIINCLTNERTVTSDTIPNWNGDNNPTDIPCQNSPCDTTNCDKPDLKFKLIAINNGETGSWLPIREYGKVEGVAADGISQLKIVLDRNNYTKSNCEIKSVQWTFENPKYGDIDKYNSLDEFVYKAPDNYPNINEDICKDRLTLTITIGDTTFTFLNIVEIEIVKVPVVMVHGFRSDPSTWNNLRNLLLNNGYDNYQLNYVNYQRTNKMALQRNYEEIGRESKNAVIKTLQQGYFASSVDIVCHSMGGLLTKKYILTSPEKNKKMFHKFITLNTPHSGSQLGDVLNDVPVLQIIDEKIKLRWVIRNQGKGFSANNVDENSDQHIVFGQGSAIFDLSVQGDEIQNINIPFTGIKCHSIVTSMRNQDCNDFINPECWLFFEMAQQLGYQDNGGINRTVSMLNDVFNNDDYDRIVALESQMGGLSFPQITHELGNFGEMNHTATTENFLICNDILNLLRLPNDDNRFSDGFGQAPILVYEINPPALALNQQQIASNNNITSRVSMQNVLISLQDTLYIETISSTSDSILYVTVNHSAGITNMSVLSILGDNIISYADSDNDTIILPAKTRGDITIMAEGKTPDNYYLSDSITVHIDNILGQTPTAIQFDEFDDTLYVFKDQYIHPSVIAIWADGDTTKVKPVFSTNDVSKIYIDDEGYIWGRNEGECTLTATAENQSCNIHIKVLDLGYLLEDNTGNNDNDTIARHSVCASVSLQISQKVTMTREAFRGTLNIHNGHESIPMENVTLNLVIKDEQGNVCNNLFHIETESLQTLTEVDGTGSLIANSDGTATILFIPTVNAAPTVAKTYSFGGTLSYLDPFSGETVTADLFPVGLEVQPSPFLHLYYFMQRDLFADDPMTENIEPSIAANLGVMVQNKGYGIAKNLSIESAQPKILDNEKGLAVNFSIIGSELDGTERQLGLTGINFGNINGQSTKVGHWWFTGSLLGHFTSYESHVRHLDSRGNPDLSLVDTVEIHELTRFITAYGNLDDNMPDFLVNDVADAHDYPDAIYFSNATRTNVNLADTAYCDGIVQPNDLEINLAVKPKSIGWNYAQLDDPGYGKYRLIRAVREDNQEIPLTNVWQTYCTMPDSREPVYENKLHFVDTLSTAGLRNYTLYFEKITANPVRVESIDNIPTTELHDTLKNVVVHFNKPISQPTFSWKDMSLTMQNDSNLLDETVTVAQINDSVYQVNFADKTNAWGEYSLQISTANIYDLQQHPGESDTIVTWLQRPAPVFTFLEETICSGDSLWFVDKYVLEIGNYADTLLTVIGGDSIINLVLSHYPVQDTVIFNAAICYGANYTANGFNITNATASNVYFNENQNINNCDSVTRLNLTVYPKQDTVIFNAAICYGANYTANGFNITNAAASNVYFNENQNINNCDSVTRLNLTVYPKQDTVIFNAAICYGANYTANGFNITNAAASNVYFNNDLNINGCDSITRLNLTVYPKQDTVIFDAAICYGANYTANGFNITNATASNVYFNENQNINNCDSVTRLNLTVYPRQDTVIFNAAIC